MEEYIQNIWLFLCLERQKQHLLVVSHASEMLDKFVDICFHYFNETLVFLKKKTYVF